MTLIDSNSIQKEIETPKCKKLELNAFQDSERKECGYFCFFNPVEKFFKDENSFSCKYIPPEISSPFPEISTKSTFNINNLVQSVVVETFCAKEKKDVVMTKRHINENSNDDDDDMKLLKEVETNLIPTKDKLEKLQEEIVESKLALDSELQKKFDEEIKEKNDENLKLHQELEQEKEQREKEEKRKQRKRKSIEKSKRTRKDSIRKRNTKRKI